MAMGPVWSDGVAIRRDESIDESVVHLLEDEATASEFTGNNMENLDTEEASSLITVENLIGLLLLVGAVGCIFVKVCIFFKIRRKQQQAKQLPSQDSRLNTHLEPPSFIQPSRKVHGAGARIQTTTKLVSMCMYGNKYANADHEGNVLSPFNADHGSESAWLWDDSQSKYISEDDTFARKLRQVRNFPSCHSNMHNTNHSFS